MDRMYIVRVRGLLSDEVSAAIDVPIGTSPNGMPWKALRIQREFRMPEASEESDGDAYFRVWVKAADSPEAARTQVEEALAGIEGVKVGDADLIGGGDVIEGRIDSVYRRAVEHFVAEAVEGSRAEQERIGRNKTGREPGKQLITAQLRGTFPDTVLRLKWYERSRDLERTTEIKIWQDDSFNAANAATEALRKWIEDMLFVEEYGADP